MPKQIRVLVTVALGIIILGGILFFAEPKSAPKPTDMNNMPSTGLKVEPEAYDFGTISMQNGLVSKSFAVKNDQPQDISVASLYTSCMCTSAKLIIGGRQFGPFGMAAHGGSTRLGESIPAGQTAELIVTFDPNAHGPSGIGPIERIVTLETARGEMSIINIKANVIP